MSTELTAVLSIKCEHAASVLAPLLGLPRVLQNFAVLVGCCSPVPSRLCLSAVRGNPMDQFSPAKLSRGKMAFDGTGFPIMKVNESVATSGAWGGTGGDSPFFLCPQRPQEQQCWAE